MAKKRKAAPRAKSIKGTPAPTQVSDTAVSRPGQICDHILVLNTLACVVQRPDGTKLGLRFEQVRSWFDREVSYRVADEHGSEAGSYWAFDLDLGTDARLRLEFENTNAQLFRSHLSNT